MKILVTGFLTLMFNFQWVLSFSLQMSWIAAFLVSICSVFFTERSVFFKQSLFFISLFPTLIFFQIPSPTSILLNICFAGILEMLLFPLALLVWFFNFLFPVFDSLIGLFKAVLQKLELEFQIQTQDMPLSLLLFNWGLIFFLHVLFHLLYVRNRRAAT